MLLPRPAFSLAIALLTLAATGCREQKRTATATPPVPTAAQIEKQAYSARFSVQSALAAELKVMQAELILAQMRTAGATELAAQRLQQAKDEATAARAEAETAMNALLAMESQTGDRTYTDKIDAFNDYARGLIRRVPGDTTSRHRLEWESLERASLEHITSGSFTSGAPRRTLPTP